MLLGVNVWEGTTWFNADAFALASVLAAAVSVATGAVMPKVALSTLDRIYKAALESGWSLERFGGPPTEPPMPAGPGTGTKADSTPPRKNKNR
jgi:hypothetical protein